MALTDAARARLLIGRDELPPAPRRFHLGALSFDLDGIDVRHVVIEGREVVNRIYVGVRDTDWNTLPPNVTGLDVRTRPDGSVAITFEAVHQGSGIDYHWRGAIEATTAGVLTYEMDGEARADFRHNRIGFCVLHPASMAGLPYRAASESSVTEGILPKLIAPQEVVDGHEVALFPAFTSLAVDFEGLRAIAAFEGDLFEMEDQRNWTDASFKTYCTPISLGYPHSAREGQGFRQRVTLSGERRGGTVSQPAISHSGLEIDVGPALAGTWPQLGLGTAPGVTPERETRRTRARLRALALDHLRVDLRLSNFGWAATLDRATAAADALACRLEVALFVGPESMAELPAAGRRLVAAPVGRVIALYEPTAGTSVTPLPWFERIERALAAAGSRAPLFTGTDGDFAELNRDRPAPGAAGLAYAVNPQVHAFDEQSLIETAPIHGLTVATARSFGTGKVAVTPVTLRGRFNPAAAEPSSAAIPEPPADPRQPSLFAAAWTLASLASFVAGRADSVTYFESVGSRGLVGPFDLGPGAPSIPAGTVYPAWFVLADVADRAGWRPAPLSVADDQRVAGLAMRRGRDLRVLLANVTPVPVNVTVIGWDAAGPRIRVLGTRNAPAAMAAPLRFMGSGRRRPAPGGRLEFELEPYAYARLDGQSGALGKA